MEFKVGDVVSLKEGVVLLNREKEEPGDKAVIRTIQYGRKWEYDAIEVVYTTGHVTWYYHMDFEKYFDLV